jgi:hypothetical protein
MRVAITNAAHSTMNTIARSKRFARKFLDYFRVFDSQRRHAVERQTGHPKKKLRRIQRLAAGRNSFIE